MAENCKVSPQTPLGAFTAPPTTLRDFYLVKIINVLYGLHLSKAWDLLTILTFWNISMLKISKYPDFL